MFPAVYNPPRFSCSRTDSILMKAYGPTPYEYLSNQSELIKKPNVQAQIKFTSLQSNDARKVPSAAVFKSEEPIPLSTIIRDAYKVLYSPETFNELNGVNDQKSFHDSLHVTESLQCLISLNEPPTVTFQEENELLQDNEELTTLSEDTSEQETQLHELQPVKFSYDDTNTANGLRQTSTLHQPNFSFPAKAQSDEWNGFIVPVTATTITSKYSYSKASQNHVDHFATPQLQQYKATMPFKHQIYIQNVPVSVEPTTAVNSSVKAQGKAERSKNIVILSNELVASPLVRSFIRTQENDMNLIKQPNQISSSSKSGEKAEPIWMAPKSIFKCPTKIVTNSTQATSITLKRKNKENILPVTSSKVQKLEQSDKITMTKADSCYTWSAPATSSERFGKIGDVEKIHAVGGINSKFYSGHSFDNKSIADCLKYLERNNVRVLRVPEKSSNELFEDYKKLHEKN